MLQLLIVHPQIMVCLEANTTNGISNIK